MPPHARHLSIPAFLVLLAALLITAAPAHASTRAAPAQQKQQVSVSQVSAITAARVRQEAAASAAAHLAHLRHLAHLGHLSRLRYLTWLAAQPVYHPPVQPAYQAPARQSYQAPAQNVSTAGDGSFQACVIARESGGQSQVMNGSGHYGLYQFSASTWAAYGGNPADFGNASVAEQNQVFSNAIAAGGQSNWSSYDGC